MIFNCEIHSIQIDEEVTIWDPLEIEEYLNRYELINSEDIISPKEIQIEVDEKLACFTRVLRYFQRSTHISDSIIQMKTGSQCSLFSAEILPELLKRRIFIQIANKGSNNQDRYKLGLPINEISESVQKAAGSFEKFLNLLD